MIPTELVPLLSRRVPRYTSYPTAVQFSADVGAETYAEWLGALAPDTTLSAYLHVPFCQHLCFFCGCNTRAGQNSEVIAAYVDALRAEIAMVAGALPERLPLKHMHWGGGTPTEIGADGIARVRDALHDAFRLEAGFEHAIELDPRRLDRGLIKSLARLGVNRVSLGVQTFDPTTQQAIGRVQPFDMVERAVGWLREEGIEAISFDLMYGLPHQTIESVIDSAKQAARLAPRRISAFGYAHVPWMKKVQGGVDVGELAGPEERFAQMEAIRDVLVDAGYAPIGFDHFAMPDDPLAVAAARGALRRNFQGYTTDTAAALIGFGASAIGRLPAGYVQNLSDARAYQTVVSEGRLPVARGCALSDDDHERAALIEDVLCSGTAALDERVPDAIRRPAIDRLQPLMRQGLVTLEGDTLRVTDAGWPFARLVATAFDAYLQEERGGHSLAV